MQPVRTYYSTGERLLVAPSRRALVVPIGLRGEGEEGIDEVIEVVDAAETDGFETAVTGEFTADRDFTTLSEEDLQKGELQFGLPAALIVLLLVFGAVVAGLVPVLVALVAIIVSLGLTALLGQAFDLSVFVVNMISGMGLALGIDYSLFVVSRYREERRLGSEKLLAIATVGSTASRAVLFSGSAFVLAMVGMVLVPDTILRSLAAGAILVGIVTVLAALTLLPAVLALIGDRVNALRVPWLGRRVEQSAGVEGRVWSRIVRSVTRTPVLGGRALGRPARGRRPAGAADGDGPHRRPRAARTVRGEAGLHAARGGVRDRHRRLGAGRRRGRHRGRLGSSRRSRSSRAASAPTVRSCLPRCRPARTAGLRTSRRSSPATAATSARWRPWSACARRSCRRSSPGWTPRASVGGETAEVIDYRELTDTWLPIVFAFVLALSFVLLTVAFRAVVLPAVAIALNLLSVGAAYGLIVLVFLEGVGRDLLGFTEVDVIAAWLPLFLFAVLFGLSMDYTVFLLSRIREHAAGGQSTVEAVAYGVASTARIITGAALIIIAVFVGFAAGDQVEFQQMGFGVAVSLLIDATVVRLVLLPAVLAILGERTWYLPRWLDWLPHLEIEGAGAGPSARR